MTDMIYAKLPLKSFFRKLPVERDKAGIIDQYVDPVILCPYLLS